MSEPSDEKPDEEKSSIRASLKAKVKAMGVGKTEASAPPKPAAPESDGPAAPAEPAASPAEPVEAESPPLIDPPPAPITPSGEEDDGSLTAREAQAWAGYRLDEIGGGAVGKVEGVYVDTETGAPEWLHARMGRFGHHSLVPARDAVAGVGHVWVPYSRDLIRAAPRLAAGSTLDRDAELALLQHYGVGTDLAGRGAEIAKRDAGTATIKPAGS